MYELRIDPVFWSNTKRSVCPHNLGPPRTCVGQGHHEQSRRRASETSSRHIGRTVTSAEVLIAVFTVFPAAPSLWQTGRIFYSVSNLIRVVTVSANTDTPARGSGMLLLPIRLVTIFARSSVSTLVRVPAKFC